MGTDYNPAGSHPPKSGVYRVRVTVRDYIGDEVNQCTGFAYWDKPLCRWAANQPTKEAALKAKHTAAWVYRAEQEKEWAPL